ncbi:hypothetical protein Naga_100245g6 [Nannochloropsis gaditana]|uniref:Uncharacterized protein n=1 Tax=Nannochloropsis gaditana TaxID=72520 RepID=W7THT7_9STRA|nr:hypothetical protein Naga_100245g6 [Nannochloropsis gaditana]
MGDERQSSKTKKLHDVYRAVGRKRGEGVREAAERTREDELRRPSRLSRRALRPTGKGLVAGTCVEASPVFAGMNPSEAHTLALAREETASGMAWVKSRTLAGGWDMGDGGVNVRQGVLFPQFFVHSGLSWSRVYAMGMGMMHQRCLVKPVRQHRARTSPVDHTAEGDDERGRDPGAEGRVLRVALPLVCTTCLLGVNEGCVRWWKVTKTHAKRETARQRRRTACRRMSECVRV